MSEMYVETNLRAKAITTKLVLAQK